MDTPNSASPWRFAPLDPKRGNPQNLPELAGIVFDVDGTLCEPQNYMFREMRQVLDISPSTDILVYLLSLPQPQQSEAWEKIHEIERRAMKVQTPQPGLQELMKYLDQRGVTKGICTRNFDEPINHLLTTFVPQTKFDPIITRDFKPAKPDPAGILHIAKAWGLPESERGDRLIMVGDSADDMEAGARAGVLTILLANKENQHLLGLANTHMSITRLDDLVNILESGAANE